MNKPNTPRVVITVKGGLIKGVAADQEMTVLIIDYDLLIETEEESCLYDFPATVGQQEVNRAIVSAVQHTENEARKAKRR
ncbi:MAG: hypothetical protein JRD89_21020 [Deltaproteobacteria bacterium]|nr:hypothetical protein [Deltaproteobacteria bacterium]